MTHRMTGPDCAVMCNLINIHTYIHTLLRRLPKDQICMERLDRNVPPVGSLILFEVSTYVPMHSEHKAKGWLKLQ